MVDRTRNLRIVVSDHELAMLHALAERDGLTGSDVMRQLLRRAYRDAFGDAEPSPKPKPRRSKR